MVPFPLFWSQFRAAQRRLRETFAESPLTDQEAHLKSSPAVARPKDETANRDVDPIAPGATNRDEGERTAKKGMHRLDMAGKDLWNLGVCYRWCRL